MKNLVTVLIIVGVLALAVVAIDGAFPTPGERAARDARAAAHARAATAWAEQADERAEAVTLFLWGMVAVTLAACAGVGAALVRMLYVRSGTLHAHRGHGLYPAVRVGGQWEVLSDPVAQQFAALPQRPTAGLARTLLGGMGMTATGRGTPPATIDATSIAALPALPSRCSAYDAPPMKTPSLLVGETANGSLSLPLQNLGNVLVGGLPGSGKSELLAAMIAGLLARPQAAQVAIIDPKMVDFGTMPPDLAGLWGPVATEHAAAIDLLGEVLAECQRRFAMLKEAGARNLAGYNNAKGGERLPYLVAFIDELADFGGDKRFGPLALEIGRKGRAAGVSLVLATQRPSTDVVDSSLRSVAGAAVAFRVRNVHDSRTIIGDGGAELLPAHLPGRCIVQRGDLVQAQAYYAGLASGHFDRYLAALPRGRGDGRRVTEAVITPVTPNIGPSWGDIAPAEVTPALPSDPAAPVSAAQRRYVIDAYRRAGGSLRATQRALFPGQTEGGHWFYWIRSIVQAEQ